MRIQRKIKQHAWCGERNYTMLLNRQKSATLGSRILHYLSQSKNGAASGVKKRFKISKFVEVIITKFVIALFFLLLESTVKLKDKINSYHWEDNKGQEWGWTLFRQCVRPPTCPLFFLDFSDIFRGLMILPSHIAALSLSLLIYILTLLLLMILYYRAWSSALIIKKILERYLQRFD